MTTPRSMDAPPKRILLATDLSARCDRALDRAASLAALWGAELAVVYAVETADDAMLAETDAIPSWRRADDVHRMAERRVLADLREAAPNVMVVVERGDPAEIILRTAEERACDLIVTGVARDEALGRLVLGGTVDRLLRRSPVPVLVVRKRGLRPYNHVVVATDFSEASRHTLETTARLFPKAVHGLFHAYDAPMAGLVAETDADRRQLREMAVEESRAFLASSDLSALEGEHPEMLLEQGAPDRLLYDYAREKDVDLVVLGTHGRSALYDVLIGSVAKRLVATLPCDTLLIRVPQAVKAGR